MHTSNIWIEHVVFVYLETHIQLRERGTIYLKEKKEKVVVPRRERQEEKGNMMSL